MMGSPFSKKPSSPLDENSGGSSSSSNNNRMESYGGMSSYETNSQNIDSILQQRTISAISILAGSEVNSITFETLKQVTGCLLENNQEVVKIILESKKDIWKSPELLELVEEYFENSLKTLDFLAALEKCLKKARDSQFILGVALRRFEEEEGEESGEEDGSKKYKRTLEELQHFKAAGDPFTEEFFLVFRSVHRQQVSMLMKLKQKKKKLDKKLKSIKAWRRVSSVIFVSAFAAVLICSVVAAVMAAPPVAAALAAAAAIPLGSVGKWIDSLWNGYSNVLQGQKDVIGTMEVGTIVAISDLDSVRVLVDRLEIQIGALLHNVDFALRGEEAVKFGIEEIKKKLEEFMTGIEDLGKQVHRSTRDIQRARTVVLHRIIKHPK